MTPPFITRRRRQELANNNNNPSIDPANNDTLAGSIRFAFGKLIQDINGMLPAQVIEYDRTANRVQVQLLISLITTDGSSIPRPQLASLPVLILGGGGYILSYPINTGDLGWVIANDRDISNFLQTYSQSTPNTYRISQFSDGLFIPDAMRGYTISSDDSAKVVLQTLDGTSKISLGTSNITITTTSTVNINAISANMDLGLPTNVFSITGSIAATGTVTGSNIPP